MVYKLLLNESPKASTQNLNIQTPGLRVRVKNMSKGSETTVTSGSYTLALRSKTMGSPETVICRIIVFMWVDAKEPN